MKSLYILSYSLLLFGVVIAGATFWYVRFSQTAQLLVIFTLILFYLFWGVVFHYAKGDLSKKLFLEYLLIALISSGVGILVFYL